MKELIECLIIVPLLMLLWATAISFFIILYIIVSDLAKDFWNGVKKS